MRKIILLVLLGISVLNYAQIRTINSEDIKLQVAPYDSTYNIKWEKNGYEKYIGQRLKVIDVPYDIQGFNKKPKNTYGKTNKREKFIGRSFTVIDAIKKGDYDIFLKLIDNDNQEIVYYDMRRLTLHNPFLCEGYYEYLKKMYINKKFYYRSKLIDSSRGLVKDIKTGEMILPTLLDTQWYFKELLIDQSADFISVDIFLALIIDDNGREGLVPLGRLKNLKLFIRVDFYDILYGPQGTDGQYILERKVKIGWTKDQCISSWGMPDKTNVTIINGVEHEQWVYGNEYLYFENGILTAIQQ